MDGQSHIYQAFNSGEWMLMVALLLVAFIIGVILMWMVWGNKVKNLQEILLDKKNKIRSKELEMDRLTKQIEDLKIEIEKIESAKAILEKDLLNSNAHSAIKKMEMETVSAQHEQLMSSIHAQAITIETLQNQIHDLKSEKKQGRISQSGKSVK